MRRVSRLVMKQAHLEEAEGVKAEQAGYEASSPGRSGRCEG